MEPALGLTVTIVVLALIFDFVNGFHDAANSVATIVATRVLTPFQAVAWAAWWNFIAALPLLLWHEAGVAKTVGAGMVNLSLVTPPVVLSGLIGAIGWDLLTWYYGLPTSSSHALVGGYAGAAVARAYWEVGSAGVASALIPHGWVRTLLFIFVAPILGMVLATLLMTTVFWLFRDARPRRMDYWFRKLQLVSAAMFSYSHGANDAQKTMGIIASALVAGGFLQEFRVDAWVVLAAHAAIALGTLAGGWRIVYTMGRALTRLRPYGGFCAETAGAIAILFPTYLKVPVSTTHVITGAIAGVGAARRPRAVRWNVASNIIWAWILTIPASALIAATSYFLLRISIGLK